MLQKNNLALAIFCLFVVTTQWLHVISISVSTNESSFKDTSSKEDEEDNNSSNNNKNNKNFMYSDEILSDEYEDDLDVNMSQQKQHQQQQDHEWDVLIFTQQWPVTTCYHWREEDKTHPCALPAKKEFWTIHGIWPTKLGHIGPNFCNKSADFNVDQLEQIMDPLNQYWPDLDGESQQHIWLWKHEWLKHGTCAAALEELNDELKYFGQGLNWRNAYLISKILGSSDIHPDTNMTVIALQTALIKVLGKNPSIHCLYDSKKDVSYLAEIRICFNKTLQLTDCDGVKLGDAISIDYPGGNVITNCHISKLVHYPSIVPAVQRKKKEHWKFPVVNMYKLLQFIMWFTL